MCDSKIIWQGLGNMKVSAAAWHPDMEGYLAFGTDAGRMGVVRTLQQK